ARRAAARLGPPAAGGLRDAGARAHAGHARPGATPAGARRAGRRWPGKPWGGPPAGGLTIGPSSTTSDFAPPADAWLGLRRPATGPIAVGLPGDRETAALRVRPGTPAHPVALVGVRHVGVPILAVIVQHHADDLLGPDLLEGLPEGLARRHP